MRFFLQRTLITASFNLYLYDSFYAYLRHQQLNAHFLLFFSHIRHFHINLSQFFRPSNPNYRDNSLPLGTTRFLRLAIQLADYTCRYTPHSPERSKLHYCNHCLVRCNIEGLGQAIGGLFGSWYMYQSDGITCHQLSNVMQIQAYFLRILWAWLPRSRRLCCRSLSRLEAYGSIRTRYFACRSHDTASKFR